MFSTEHLKGKYWLFLKNYDRKINAMDEVGGNWPLWRGWKKTEWPCRM